MMILKTVGKIILILVSLIFFILGIKLMQAGIADFGTFIRDHLKIQGVIDALGFGWLGAYALLSGSPIAAMAVTLFGGGEIQRGAAFAMIIGSRLGSAFVVLVVGFFYFFWHRALIQELKVGLLSLIVTATICLPAFLIGLAVLTPDFMNPFFETGNEILKNGTLQEVQEKVQELLPSWAIFSIGLVLLIAGFKLFDWSLPSIDEKDEKKIIKFQKSFIFRPGIMLGLGLIITMLSLSVSISLSILVPLFYRRLISLAQIIPYIFGANIATFSDTLLLSFFDKNSGPMIIVLTAIISITIISLILFFFFYKPYEKMILSFLKWTTDRPLNLIFFIAFLIALPGILLLF